jgi:EGF-like domain
MNMDQEAHPLMNSFFIKILFGAFTVLTVLVSIIYIYYPLTSSAGTTVLFTKNLQIGSSDAEVYTLQHYLNVHGFPIATSGVGSLNNETTFFGKATKSALVRFQNYHRADILTPQGLTVGTGKFYSATRSYINTSLETESSATTTALSDTASTTIATSSGRYNLKYDPNGNYSRPTEFTYSSETTSNSTNNTQQSLINPEINFLSIPTKYYGDDPFTIQATSTSDGSITYTSSNADVATINGNTVTIIGAGSTDITAVQTASGSYSNASTTISLLIHKANPHVSVNDMNVTFNGSDVVIGGNSSSTADYYYVIGNTSIAGIDGSITNNPNLIILSPGTTTISRIELGDANYEAGTSTATLVVNSSCSDSLCSAYGNSCMLGSGGSHSCTCDAGMTGSSCDIAIDSCAFNPCGVHGTCQRTSTFEGVNVPLNSYQCTCDSDYSGATCDIAKSAPTIHMDDLVEYYTSGTPFTISLSPTSSSTGTYTFLSGDTSIAIISGDQCTINSNGITNITVNQAPDSNYLFGSTSALLRVFYNACQNNPCQNGGTCTPNFEGYQCACPDGFSGSDCSTVGSSCGGLQCQNGATCSNDGTTCQCTPCFMGPDCSQFDVVNCS